MKKVIHSSVVFSLFISMFVGFFVPVVHAAETFIHSTSGATTPSYKKYDSTTSAIEMNGATYNADEVRVAVTYELKNQTGSGNTKLIITPYNSNTWNGPNGNMDPNGEKVFYLPASSSGTIDLGTYTHYSGKVTGFQYTFDFSPRGGVSYTFSTYYTDKTAPTTPAITINPSGWSNTAVTGTIGGSTDTSGIAGYKYRIDNGSYTDYNGTISFPEGQHSIEAYAIDNSGIESQHATATAYYDATAPTAPVLSGTGDTWHTQDTTISIQAGADQTSGIRSTEYALSGATETGWTSGTSVNISNEGQTTINARSIDNAGNISSITTGTMKIDKTKPELNVTAPSNYAGNIDIHASASDSISRIKQLILPNGSIVAGDSAVYNVNQNGTYSFTAEDYAGNTTVKEITIRTIDQGAPQISISPESKNWSADAVEATIQYSDQESKVKDRFYQLTHDTTTPNSWETATEDKQTISITDQGSWYIHAAAVDEAGNRTETIAGPFQIQAVPEAPQLQASLVKEDSITLAWSHPEESPSHDGLTYEIENMTTGRTYKVDYPQYQLEDNGLASGHSYQYRIRASNHSGMSEYSVPFRVDTIDSTPPEITLSSVPTDWGTKPVDVNIHYEDHQSGLDSNQLFYKVTTSMDSPSSWDTATNDMKVTVEHSGIWYVHAAAVDQAGNRFEKVVGPIQIQSHPETPQLEIVSTTDQSLQLQWQLPDGNEFTDGLHYIIQNVTTGKEYHIDYPKNEMTDEGLQSGTLYEYRIQAMNHVGESEYSRSVSAYTRPSVTSNIRIQPIEGSTDKALLSFDSVHSANQYHIMVTDQQDQSKVVEQTVISSTYYELQHLVAGHIHNISVSAVNSSGEGNSASTSFLSLPVQPGDFNIFDIQKNTISMSWNTVTSAVYYELQRNGRTVYQDVYNGYTDQHLSAGTDYKYKLTAMNATGSSGSVNRTIMTLPKDIGVVTATAGDTYIKLQLPTASVGADHYRVTATSGDSQTVQTFSGNQYDVTGLLPGKVYTLTVEPMNDSGAGAASQIIYATLPAIPASTLAADIAETSAVITFPDVEGASRYRISINNKQYETTGRSFKIDGLTGGTHYTYSVEAGNSSGYGQSIRSSFITVPSAPGPIHATANTSQMVSIQWQPSVGANKYMISDDNGHVLGVTDIQTFTFQSLHPGKTYTYFVSAVNDSGQGKAAAFTWRTIPGEMDHQSITVETKVDEAIITWPPIEGADHYAIYDGEHLIDTVEGHEYVLHDLNHAASYDTFTIVPINSTGAGLPQSVPTFYTKPSTSFTMDTVTTKKTTEFTIHAGDAHDQIYVIRYNDQIIYKGADPTFIHTGLKSGTDYKYEYWAENSIGDRSNVRQIIVTTKKEKKQNDATSNKQDGKKTNTQASLPEHSVSHASDQDHDSTKNIGDEAKHNAFTDLDHVYGREIIESLIDRGVIHGTTDTTFEPQRSVTRAEFMSMLVRLEQTSNIVTSTATSQTDHIVNGLLSFYDVSSNDWFYEELLTAYQHKMVKGMSAHRFMPAQTVTREQAAKMIGSSLSKLLDAQAPIIFADQNVVAEWADVEVRSLSNTKILLGYPNGTFKPKQQLTRAEAAMLLWRYDLQSKSS